MKCTTCGNAMRSAENRLVWACLYCGKTILRNRTPGDADLYDDLPAPRASRPAASSPVSQTAALSITFEFPLPPRGCSPNGDAGRSNHWSAKSSARAQYREECYRLLPRLDAMFDRATISTEFYLAPDPERYHPRDEQNAIASIKALVDAVVDAGYIPDDSAKYVHWGETTLRSRDHGGKSAVRLTLTRWEGV